MNRITTYNFGWIFMIVAWAILTFGWDVTWYWAALIVILANFEFKITTTRYRRPFNIR